MESRRVAPPNDIRPCRNPDTGATARLGHHSRLVSHVPANAPSCTLETLCQSVIVANLERYPPECFSILSEDQWNVLVRLRHERTAPTTGTGGLDGTGRVVPAISDRFLSSVEQNCPHLADSRAADQLIWSDCVEYKFKTGGLTRPRQLQYPWPVLVERLHKAGSELLELMQVPESSENELMILDKCIQTFHETPMNVALLQASGVGRSVKKFVKAFSKVPPPSSLDVTTERAQKGSEKPLSPISQLQTLLQMWKDIAAKSGVEMNSSNAGKGKEATDASTTATDDEDMMLAQSCLSWRELFMALEHREVKRRANQGARMREMRKNLAKDRPKIVKVVPIRPRHAAILNRPLQNKPSSASASGAAASGTKKLHKLRKESSLGASRQKSSALLKKKPASFGAAVAFASVSKASRGKGATTKAVSLTGGKSIKLPAKVAKSAKNSKHTKRGPKPTR